MNIFEHLEVRRQMFHFFLGVLVILLIYFDIIGAYIISATIFLGVIMSLLSINTRVPYISWFLDKFDRKLDRKKFPGKGALTFFLGTLFAVVLFDKNIALASITVLAVGDSFSHVIGRYFGRIKNPFSFKKIEGTVAAVFLSALAASFFIPLWAGFAGSFVAMLVESINDSDLLILNDNLFIPLLSGFVISFLI